MEKEKSDKKKTYISLKKKQKGALGAPAAIDAQVGSQVIGGLIDKIF